MENMLTLSVVNFRATSGDKEGNLQAMLAAIEAAHVNGASLVLLPELCLQGYDLFVDPNVTQAQRVRQCEPLDGPSVQAIAARAKALSMYAVFGMGELSGDVLYNTAVAVTPQGDVHAYRKIHPFAAENLAFAKGDAPLLLDTPWGPVGIGICYDTYQFPELMRYYAHHGARLYLNPTAVAQETEKPGSRQAFLRYYLPTLEYGVLCNTIYIASANLVGMDRINHFGGASLILGPCATDFAETDVAHYAGSPDTTQPGIFTATVDLSLATRRLFTPNPHTGTPDFRPEIYRTFYE